MKRFGSSLVLSVITICYCLFPNVALALDPKWAPEFYVTDTSVSLCSPESICFDISATDPDVNDRLILNVTGAVTIADDTTFSFQLDKTICFLPDTAGVYMFAYHLVDRQNHHVYDTSYVTVVYESSGVIEDQSFSSISCDLTALRYLDIQATVSNGSALFSILSGPGTIDPQSGLLTYQPDTSGLFTFEVALTSDCGADTAIITD
ncbi:MAG: hypothetical protein V3T31_11965, partial [candidate division Zixibacteria bacterium]